MIIINPIVLAGGQIINQYQQQRIQEWTQQKGESQQDFSEFFADIINQWSENDYQETSVDIDEFKTDGIDDTTSENIRNNLIKYDLINSNGFINLKKITPEKILESLEDFPDLSEDQKNHITDTLKKIQNNMPVDFETIPSSLFVNFLDVDEETAASIWSQLNNHQIIDDYGVPLIETKSNELTQVINKIDGLTDDQKKTIIQIINQHPAISYHSYLKTYQASHDTSENLPSVGIYMSGSNAPTKSLLTKEELDAIKIIAIMEWNVFLISEKMNHKKRKQSAETNKKEKRKDKEDMQIYLAKMEAKHKEASKRESKRPKKSRG